jgi:uncharacterized protein (DUF4415 family)
MLKSERIVSYTASKIDEMIARGEDLTDWDRVRNMTPEEIEANVDEDDEGYFDLSKGYAGLPPGIGIPKKQLTVRLDTDVIDWFKSQGKGYQTRMNAVLRQFMEHEKGRST